VSPPSQFNFTQFGGFGYVPTNAGATGAGTRTALGVRTGWFFNQTQARDLVAHELAHNFGRRHSPCGGPGSIDAAYPRSDGRLGETMHDVYAWAHGITSTLQAISAETGDLMGYCFPSWSSAYTYQGILNFRGSAIAASRANRRFAPREDVMVVQGSIAADGAVTLDNPIVLRGYRTPPDETAGLHRLEGVDANGTVVFAQSVHAAEVDHADVRLFTVAIPLASSVRAHMLRLVTPRGTVTLAASGTDVTPHARRSAGDVVVSCGVPNARVAVQDARTDAVLGIGRGPLRIARAGEAHLAISCANGAVPRRAMMTPR